MSCVGVSWHVSWRWGAAGRAARRGRTAPESGRPRSSRSATRRSPVRRAAGRATRTTRARRSTRSARPRTATTRRRGEAIRGCHRSKSAEVHIGGGVLSANLACSGAQTSTNAGGSDFKPGIDFYSDSSGRNGQALALQQLRGDPQREGRHAAHRREQLRLRRHRPAVRDRLADVAVVVAELLQRRLERSRPGSPPRGSRPRPRTSPTRSSTCARR